MASKKRDSSVVIWIMLAPYLVFLVMFAVVPIWMALKESVGPTMRNEAGGFKNYLLVLTDYRFLTSLKNTVLYVLVSAPIMTSVVLVLSLLLDSFRAKWHQYVRLAYLIPGCYVGAAGVLAWYMALEPIIGPFRRVLNFFGIEKSTQVFQPSSLVFIFAMMAVVSNAGAWIVVQFGGLQEISEEVIEAAKIDGCGYFKIFRKVALPVSKSLAGIVAFFSFLGAWNSFFLPQVFILSGEKHPLSSGLVVLFTNVKAFCGCEPSLLPIFRSEIALSALILITPTIYLFMFAQRFLSRGMLAGSVKS